CSNPAGPCASSSRARRLAASGSRKVQAWTTVSLAATRERQSPSRATALISRVASLRAAAVALRRLRPLIKRIPSHALVVHRTVGDRRSIAQVARGEMPRQDFFQRRLLDPAAIECIRAPGVEAAAAGQVD